MTGYRGYAAVLVLCAVALVAVAAQPVSQSAWIVRTLEGSTTSREHGKDILDTPILPGSIMKIVTLVAALESHAIDARTTHVCRRVVTVDGRRYVCSHPDVKRPMTVAEALAYSCNDFFLSLAPRLSRDQINRVRGRVGLAPVMAGANFSASLIGLDGPRISPRALLEMFVALTTEGKPPALAMPKETRTVLLDGLRGAATYGSAAELGSRGVAAFAKTGTAPMPGGGVLGIMVALTETTPRRAVIVVAPGAAGRDAASIAVDLLAPSRTHVRIGHGGANGRVVVETLDLEDYVARVVSGEGEATSAGAAQQALAIAVRTFTLANRHRHEQDGYDLCDTTHCQVMRAATPRAIEATAATRARVLMHAGAPAAIFYSAWCGGTSELASSVWPGALDMVFQRVHDDEACGGEPGWRTTLTVQEIEHALRAAGFRGDRLRELRIIERTASGRVARIAVEGFVPREISGPDLRTVVGRTIGWERLKSALFELRRTANGYDIVGRGAGHGVGLCVLGAGRRARRGATAAEILRVYYPGLRVQPYVGDAPPPVSTPSRRQNAVDDVLLSLPIEEEAERRDVLGLVRRARDEITARAGVPSPRIRVTVHATVAAFTRATKQPWWTAGATSGASIDLLSVKSLRTHHQLERTIRHEVAHVMVDGVLADRALWIREGAAVHFAGDVAPPPDGETAGPPTCPSDDELRQPRSSDALRAAYASAARCFRAALAGGTSWRQVR